MKISFQLHGLGDELALTPAIREIRRRHPKERMAVEGLRYSEIWNGNPHLPGGSEDKLGEVKIDTGAPGERSLPVQFARQLGVELQDDRPEFYLSSAEINENYGIQNWTHTIAVDVFSSAVARRWPHFPDAIRLLERQGWRVIEVGRSPWMPQKCYRSFLNQLTVRQTAGVLSRCSLYLGNDSGLMHLAAAVWTPQVVIYSTAKWRHRAYWNTVSLQASCACHLGVYACDKTGPEKPAACLAEIPPERVLEAVNLAARRFTVREASPRP